MGRWRRFAAVALFVMAMAVAPCALAQFGSPARRIVGGSGLPATCISSVVVVDIFVLNQASVYLCTAANTWTLVGPGAGGPPTGVAGGDLTGTYPNPTLAVARLTVANNLSDLANAATARGNLGLGSLATQNGTFSGTSSGTNTGDQTITLTGPVTGGGAGSFATTITPTAVTPGSYTNTNLTVGADGRLTAASTGSGGGLAADGSTVGATAQVQVFTNGVKTTATTGKVGVGMTPVAMLDVTAPAAAAAIKAVGTAPASGLTGTSATDIMTLTGAAGGVSTSSGAGGTQGGSGGAINITLGTGGAQTGNDAGDNNAGGPGGSLNVTGGTGGAATSATGAVQGGAGGGATLIGGPGGACANADIAGTGGGFSWTSGPGGNATAAGGTAGTGGPVLLDAGVAGTASGGAAAGSAGAMNFGITNAKSITIGRTGITTTINGETLTTATSRITADVTNATTTFANLTGISRTVLAAGKYAGELKIKCNNSVAAEGIKLDFNGGTATMTSFWAGGNVLIGGADVLGTGISTSLTGVVNFSTITGETIIIVEVSFVVNAAGTVIPRFAENSHATGTVTAELGSFMTLSASAN